MILEAFRLEHKVALVTGAAAGLGQALALALAEAGADIILLDVQACDDSAHKIQALGRQSHSITRDLAGLGAEQASQLIDSAAAVFGSLDILVNNAGIIRRSEPLSFSEKDWREVLDVNLNACFFLAQAAAKHFSDQHKPGKIINMASMLSFQGGRLVPSYTAAKSAIAGLTKALASDLAGLGINVNAIAPGYMSTNVTAALRADPLRSKAILERIPAGHWGDPDDLKGACVFLASEASRYVHGAILPVDGGWLTR